MKAFLKSFRRARAWTDCFPLGNGNIGVMDDGGVLKNTVCLNDDGFWSGDGRDKSKEAAEPFERARGALNDGRTDEAETIIWREMLGDWTESYLPVGKIEITLKGCRIVKNYSRTLDINNAVHRFRCTLGDAAFECESFVSHPDGVYVKKIFSGKPLSCAVKFKSEVRHSLAFEGNTLYAECTAPSSVAPPYHRTAEPVKYDGQSIRLSAALKIITDGTLNWDDGVFISNFTELCFIYCSKTALADKDNLKEAVFNQTEKAAALSYSSLKDRHIVDYRQLYDRVDFTLNGVTSSPEDTRAALKKSQKDRDVSALICTLFAFGRYLTIASSRIGTAASNLQGIWNNILRPPWSSNYTVNINTQMNYWPAEAAALPECAQPLFDLITKISEKGAVTAKKTFGLSGWCAGHNSDIWGHSSPVGGSAVSNPVQYGYFIGTAGWLCHHLYQHYKFTEDSGFLSAVLPVMREAVRFYLDYLKEADGRLIPLMGTSPENSYTEGGVRLSLARASTSDIAIIRTLFKEYAELCAAAVDDELKAEAEQAAAMLPPYALNGDGTICEWLGEKQEVEPHHRHLSHLYGVYPADDGILDSPELTQAAKKTLAARGNGGTGWSLAWKVCLYARLKEGDRAEQILKRQLYLVKRNMGLRGGSYASLLGAHPPFQIDGNFGVTAGIIEMLVQCRGDSISLLPALPSCWKSGSITGIKAVGNKTVSLWWEDGKITKSEIF